MITPLTLLGLLSAAAAESSASDRFAAEAVRICVETRADPAAVRALAAAEGWTALDPATVPSKSSITLEGKKKKDNRTFNRNQAWTIEKAGVAMTVGLFDFPEAPNVRQCDLLGWDLDFDSVDAAFRADSRFSGGSAGPGLPIRMYSVSGVRASVSYLKSDTGTKQIHAVSVNPLL